MVNLLNALLLRLDSQQKRLFKNLLLLEEWLDHMNNYARVRL